jgi:hypothetical protein
VKGQMKGKENKEIIIKMIDKREIINDNDIRKVAD